MNRLSLFLIAMVLICQTTNTNATDLSMDVGYLGLSSEKISKDKAKALGFDNPFGSYVTKVWPNTPAAKVKLQVFDYIYGIDNQFVARYKDLDDFLKFKEPGDEVLIHFVRKKDQRTVRVKLGQRSNTFYYSTTDDEKGFFGVTDDCNCPEGQIGVTVSIVYNSTAQKMGLKDGDIITAINGFPMYDWADISTAITNIAPGNTILVSYQRNGRSYTASEELKSLKATKSSEHEKEKHAKPAFLGLYSELVSKEKARKLGYENAYGSYVTSIIPNTAAEKANIQPFDYIYGIDEYRVGENQNLSNILIKYREGEEAKIYYIRKGRELTDRIEFGTRGAGTTPRVPKSDCEDPFLGVRNDYRTFSEKGISVTVVKNSTADEMGMENGDVIMYINDYMIVDWTDISIAIDNMKVGQPIEVIYLRNGQQRQSSRPIKSHCNTLEETEKQRIKSNQENDSQIIIKGRNLNPNARGNTVIRISDPTGRDLSNLSIGARTKIDKDQNLRVDNLNLNTSREAEKIMLSFKLLGRGYTQIRIFNQNGRSLYNYELDSFSGTFKDDLDISNNNTGIYYLYIQQNNESLIKKILLQKQ